MFAKKYDTVCATTHACVLQGWSESVVVEPYQAAAESTEFSVTVIGTSKGPVALLPMEAEVFDYADDIFEADLDFEAYKARREVCAVCLSPPGASQQAFQKWYRSCTVFSPS